MINWEEKWQQLSPKKSLQDIIHGNGMRLKYRVEFTFIDYRQVHLRKRRNLFYWMNRTNHFKKSPLLRADS